MNDCETARLRKTAMPTGRVDVEVIKEITCLKTKSGGAGGRAPRVRKSQILSVSFEGSWLGLAQDPGRLQTTAKGRQTVNDCETARLRKTAMPTGRVDVEDIKDITCLKTELGGAGGSAPRVRKSQIPTAKCVSNCR